jgi:DNA-binding beta-propeller fold protein YncE
MALVCFLLSPAAEAFEVSGLAMPESFIVDRLRGEYYISNVAGDPVGKDGHGFITKLDATGNVIARKFIDSTREAPLHAPKGLAIVGDYLFVADIDHLKGYEKHSGRLRFDLDLTAYGAVSLTDVTRDAQGNLYVSDRQGNFIAKIEPIRAYAISILARGAQLGRPNGLAVNPKTDRLVMVNGEEGRLYEVAADGRVNPLVNHTFKDVGGVDFDAAGNLYLSSITGGTIYKVTEEGAVSVIAEHLVTPADIGVDRRNHLLLIPSFDGNSVMTLTLP